MAYDPRKAAQTVAFFALKEGGRINVLKVTKLVYLADRESIRQYGFPIQDETHVSMEHGPVNSDTRNFMCGDYEDAGWSEFVSDRAGHDVGVARPNITEYDLDELSDADLDVLSGVWDQFGQMGKYEIRDYTHSGAIPEWTDPGKSSTVIPLESIMESVGLPVEQARCVREMSALDTFLRSL